MKFDLTHIFNLLKNVYYRPLFKIYRKLALNIPRAIK